MTKTFEIKGVVSWVRREKNSVNGNPRWTVCVYVGGHFLPNYAKTATDAMIGYECSSYWVDKEKTFLAHFTKGGNLVLDRLIGE